ncbi:hypothetical protein Hanom_Chr03g00243861 [Helianthus anomalus]
MRQFRIMRSDALNIGCYVFFPRFYEMGCVFSIINILICLIWTVKVPKHVFWFYKRFSILDLNQKAQLLTSYYVRQWF